MIQITKNISVDGFESRQHFDEWLKDQGKNMPKSVMLKMFNWFLMRLEENVKDNKYNQGVIDGVDKYAVKVIDNKIMKEEDVIKYIKLAMGWEE